MDLHWLIVWMHLQTASCCRVECEPHWMEFTGQFSLFGFHYNEYQTLTSCQDYCITVSTCVAVDFSLVYNKCWLHVNTAHLSKDTTFSHNGTNQYRLNRNCSTATSGQLISCLLASIVVCPIFCYNYFELINKNTFHGTRYLSHCCSLYCCRDIKPQIIIAYIRVASLTFTWRHRSRDRTIRYIWFPIIVLLILP